MKYDLYRKNIKSGDLLIWSTRKIRSMSDVLDIVVRVFTLSEYNHVGIAWDVADRKFIIEAVPPKVRIYPLSRKGDFYHIPMNLPWSYELEERLLSYVGDHYSIPEAILSYFSRPDRNQYWQCAELVSDFYMNAGYDDLINGYTPAKLVNLLVNNHDLPLNYVEM